MRIMMKMVIWYTLLVVEQLSIDLDMEYQIAIHVDLYRNALHIFFPHSLVLSFPINHNNMIPFYIFLTNITIT